MYICAIYIRPNSQIRPKSGAGNDPKELGGVRPLRTRGAPRESSGRYAASHITGLKVRL